MNTTEVLALLEANRNDRGVENWKKLGPKTGELKSFGIGLTQLRKLAKQIGRDRDLALNLWKGDVYDGRIIALLIDDPKAMTEEQAETQVEELGAGELAHVFSSCGATLAQTSFVVELALKWINGADAVRRRCGYGLLHEVSKSKKKTAPDDAFFLERIEHIRKTFDQEEGSVRFSMGGALMGIGMRNATLHTAALQLARSIGPIQFDPSGRLGPFDPVKHLTSDHVKNKLGVLGASASN